MSAVRIRGGRQAGKTELMLAAAASWARQGKFVLFVADSWAGVHNAFVRFTHGYADDSDKVYRANGNEHVRYATGGRVQFISQAAARRFTGAEVVILDGVGNVDVEFEFPAARIYRTSL